MHIILLGDSVFDNQSYVKPDESDVRGQFQDALPEGDQVTLLAIDGSIIETVFAQLKRLPRNATHLIISAGGNNLIGEMHTFNQPTTSTLEVLQRVGRLATTFRQNYRSLIQTVVEYELPTVLCTMYNPRFPETELRQAAMIALSVFNDAIIQEAVTVGLPVVDLRLVCTEDTDFANPIEPSARGGTKIVRSLMRVLHEHNFKRRQTVIYGL
ncbi:MAG TPA: SGNH/GDSL hydrolase family protein [Phototrophicaceae bacterium]|jgi:lysophospholipase L1-like esterase|nr:SGNH/GDSL hydrolase family protein [Phototrophicaceae bacterium]